MVDKERLSKSCCFIGHRKIDNCHNLKDSLKSIIEDLIRIQNVNTFFFGSRSEFDEICYLVVTSLKEKYPHIKRIYVRAEFPYIDKNYNDYLLKYYEATYFPESVIRAGKAAYIERNYEMLDKSDFAIFYYNTSYEPQKKKRSGSSKSGTKIAYEHAKKKNLRIINVFC